MKSGIARAGLRVVRSIYVPAILVLAIACSSTRSPPAPTIDAGTSTRQCNAASPYDSCAGRVANACKGSCFWSCQAWCDPGFADCNRAISDGCEVDLLHDPSSCGACGAAAPACVDGLGGPAPQTLGDCGFRARGLAVDATTLYAMCDGDLTAMPKGGGERRLLARDEWGDARAGLVVDGGFVYWAWPSIAKSGAVRRMPVGGGPIETVIDGINPSSNLLVHDGVVYVVDAEDGTAPKVASIVDATGRTLASVGSAVTLVAVGDVLYARDGTGKVHSVRFDGTAAGDVPVDARALASDGTVLFVFDTSTLAVYQTGILEAPRGAIPVSIRRATMAPGDTTIFGTSWAKTEDGCLGGPGAEVVIGVDAVRAGGVVRARIPGHDGILSTRETIDQLAVDDGFVYYATSSNTLAGAGKISRFAK